MVSSSPPPLPLTLLPFSSRFDKSTKQRGSTISHLSNRGRPNEGKRLDKKHDILRAEGTSALMGLEKKGTHLIDIDSAEGKQVLDNFVLPVVGSVRQKGL